MQFLLYTALAAAALVKRQVASTFDIRSATYRIAGSISLSPNGAVISTPGGTVATNTSTVAPLMKRQVGTTLVLWAGPCVPGQGVGSGFNSGPVPVGQAFDLTGFCATGIASISATFPDGSRGCSPLSPPISATAACQAGRVTTVVTTATTVNTNTIVTSVTQITNINIKININVTIGACAVCGQQTYYYLTQCYCPAIVTFITTYGVVYNCPANSIILVTRPYVIQQGVTTVIQVPSISSTAVVPVITITTQGVVATAPATTLANVVTQAVVTVATAQQPVVTPFTGAANKAGLGAIAAIAGAAALL